MADDRTRTREEEPAPGGPEEATHPGDPEAPEQHPVASGIGGLTGGAAGAAAGGAVGGPVGAVVGTMVGGAAGVAAGKRIAEETHPTDEGKQTEEVGAPSSERDRP
jgi:hypothetical protein